MIGSIAGVGPVRSAAHEGLARRACISVLFAAVVAWGSASCGQEPPPPPESEPSVDPRIARITQGKVFYEANCTGCHGAGALGDGPMAASLPVQPANIMEHLADHSDDDMIRRITEGIPPAMPPASINTDEVRQVMAYVWSLVPDSARSRLRALQATAEETH